MPEMPKVVLVISILVLSGCGGALPDRSAVEVYDSAGIEVVHSHTARWEATGGWRLDSVPLLSIGRAEGDEEYLLHRVAGSTRLSDGRIVVADGGSRSLRYYDAAGQLLMRTGGAGEGPGEFQFIGRPERIAGDSVAIFDLLQQRRVSIVGPDGRFARFFNLAPHEDGPPLFAGAFADGSFVVWASRAYSDSDEVRGLSRDSITYYTVTPEGEFLRPLVRVPGSEAYQHPSVTVMVPVFGRVTAAAVGGSGLFIGFSDIFEIEYYDAQGDLTRLIRREYTPRPVSDHDIEEITDERIQRSVNPQNMARLFQSYPFPESFPAYQSMNLDVHGNLWVAHYQWPEDAGMAWTVFAPDGIWLGVVETPAGLTIHDIGDDYILGRHTDELGIERIQLYRLIKD